MTKFIYILLALSLIGCGKQGPAGTNGTQGANGQNGANGVGCTVSVVPANVNAPNGGSLVTCANNTQSLILNGSNGIQGSQGIQGVAGTNGSNGTVITPIQFCGGVTGNYPSTFPEVGFCINNSVYAVYSANGGFLTEVLPGTWSSNGINASCTFTVGPNCQVN